MEERIEPHVTGVQVLSTVLERKRSFNRQNGRRDRGRTGKEVDEAVKHAEELRDAAETANGKLASRNSPYRFYVYNEGGEIYLNLVILCEDGSIQETGRKNITHEAFSDCLIHLERGEGLLFDKNG